ncbi:SnoaL-like domain-containing protein [Amycolatopsis xylanica]|uniref:SnoaL-like domain-containing protein n=1 Tax=Amycolatopsis xylanica TaxID=589385 RepID=A0A1H3JSM6_9PSEU|nr:nuclear transport factor 2 family protein [Amycolatopsis xylanica]SDY42932.1 SnoaL-like domain-containing protein [Amycolatopsis xylanica]
MTTLLADRIEIADLFSRLAHLLDGKRWDDAATVFTTDVALHSPRNGELRGLDTVVAFMRQAEVAGESTQHITSDLLVEVDGDQATASANSVVYFFRDGEAPHRTSGLRLACTVVRTSAGWRLAESWTTLAWMRQN